MTPGRPSRRSFLLGLTALAGCGRPKGKGFPGYVFVANQDDRSVAVVDLTGFSLSRQIRLEAAPNQVIAHPAKPAVYVLSPQAIFEIDASAMAVRRKTRLPATLVSARLSPDGHSIWALCREPHELIRVPLDVLRPAERIRIPGAPVDFDLNREGSLAAVALPGEQALGVLDLSRKSLLRSVRMAAGPCLVRFRSDGSYLLAGSAADRMLSVADVASGRTVVRLPLPLEPASFCFKSDGGELYVTGPGMDAVVIVFPYTTEIGETILAGNAPGAMAALGSPPYLFVANPESGDLTVLDTDTRKLAATVRVGTEPCQVLFTPDNEYALVLNRKSGDIAVIRVAALRSDHTGRTRRYKMAPLFTMIPVGAKPVSAVIVRV